jgi:hypothetical protein
MRKPSIRRGSLASRIVRRNAFQWMLYGITSRVFDR